MPRSRWSSTMQQGAARVPKRSFFFFQAEDGIRDYKVTGVQTCALPISPGSRPRQDEPFADGDRRPGPDRNHAAHGRQRPGGVACAEKRREHRQARGTAVVERPAVAVIGGKEDLRKIYVMWALGRGARRGGALLRSHQRI